MQCVIKLPPPPNGTQTYNPDTGVFTDYSLTEPTLAAAINAAFNEGKPAGTLTGFPVGSEWVETICWKW